MKTDTSNIDILVMIISATIVLIILLCFLISFIFIYKSRQARHLLEVKEIRERYDREILVTQLEIKEQTLKNISEEIHDNVGQVLSLVILNLSSIEFADLHVAARKIEHVTNLVKKAISDLRNLSKTLDSENIADVGLAQIIGFELDLIEKTGLYQVSFKVTGQERRLDPSREIVVYRIIQESINNMIKHAQASAITISLAFSTGELAIEIADNGKGFDLALLNTGDIRNSGAGIKNMKSRAGLIDAALDIKSIPSQGTRITLKIPFATQKSLY